MSRAFDRVDKETLKRDDQLVEVLKKIKEKVLSGHIVELKTLTNQSSEIDQMSEKPLNQLPSVTNRTDPITGRTDNDLQINTQTDRESKKFLDHSFNKHIAGPSNQTQQVNKLDQSSESEFSHQSFYSDEEPWNIEYITNQLTTLDERLTSDNCSQVIIAVKTLFEQIRLLLNRNLAKKDFLHKYTVLAIRSLFILGNAMKMQGNYNNALLYYENCLNKFVVNEPATKGKLLIEIGKVSFISYNFQKSQKYLYEALLHYEKLNWRIDIAYSLVLLARLNGWLSNHSNDIENPETANKLCYEGLAIFREYLTEEDDHIVETYYILAELAYLKKDIDGAFQFVEQSVSMSQVSKSLCQAYNLLGILYANSHDYKQSYNYFLKAFQCVKNDGLRSAQILQNWAVMQALDCNQEQAQKGFLKAKKIQLDFALKTSTAFKDRLDKNYVELIS